MTTYGARGNRNLDTRSVCWAPACAGRHPAPHLAHASPLFPHLALAAFLAIADRCSGVSFLLLAGGNN